MENFLESNDPYIIIMGIEKINRELDLLNHSLLVVKGKCLVRERKYSNEIERLNSIKNKLNEKRKHL